MLSRRACWVCGLLAWGWGAVVPAAAFAQANLPGSVEPGQIERRFEQPPPPRSTLAPVVPALPEQRLAPAQAEKIKLVLSSLQLTGSTVYTEADFASFYQPHLWQVIFVAPLCD